MIILWRSSMPFLDTKHFESIRFEIQVSNSTSKVAIPQSGSIKLEEFSSDSMTLSLPPRSCAQGHHLKVDLKAIRGNLREGVAATALVQEVTLSPTGDLVKLRL